MVVDHLPNAKRQKLFEGLEFNGVTLVERVKKYNSEGRIIYYWMVRCSCGKLFEIQANSLHYPSIKDCGCKVKGGEPKYTPEQYIGKVYGDFKVIDYKKEVKKYVCECMVCKIIKIYNLNTLYSMNSMKKLSCEKYHNKKKKSTKKKKKIKRTIDNFMTTSDAARRWKIQRTTVRDKIKWDKKTGKINDWIEQGLIKEPYVEGGSWIVSTDMMEIWYGIEPTGDDVEKGSIL